MILKSNYRCIIRTILRNQIWFLQSAYEPYTNKPTLKGDEVIKIKLN